jgi:hypothetical protein
MDLTRGGPEPWARLKKRNGEVSSVGRAQKRSGKPHRTFSEYTRPAFGNTSRSVSLCIAEDGIVREAE